MLIALELAGFKSFAEKTRFDFPDGITVVVGPNGSGKSNVVDAIKWVLGAQSAKAMRGKEMTDVIFKGSNSAGRSPSNSAEATLVFDNKQQVLHVDSPEVQVTRRVYRSGEGEYLINGQPCRLKDIKDLFRGTGVGVDAYSLIEQGKVDRMLQASPKDRRVIFEEAAGISRFNAKKQEAARRMARVDQNMVRLKDIVDEVGTRLATLKGQATKAQRYREMTARLHQIRLQAGWTEHQQLASSQAAASDALATASEQLTAHEAELVEAQQSAQQAELDLHQVAANCQEVEAKLQDSLQRIAVGQNQQQSLQERVAETGEQRQRHAQKLVALRTRARELDAGLREATAAARQAQADYRQAKEKADLADEKSRDLKAELSERTRRHDELRKQHVELLREASEGSTEVAKQKNALTELLQNIYQAEKLLEVNSTSEQKARKAAEHAALRLKQIHEQNESASNDLERAKQELEQNSQLLAKHMEQAAVQQGRLEGATERLEILQQLQQHLEGVDAGARHLLELKQNSGEPAYQSIQGLVAELLEVEVNLAPLIDTALGAASNSLIVQDGDLFQLAREGNLEVPGRLSLIRLDRIPTRRFGEKVQLDGVRGVIGRADRLVQFAEPYDALFRYLLGTTWLVESLDVALELGHFRGAGLRFVTAACELLDADGTLTVGSLQTTGGLVSRRSEIQNAQQEISDCKALYQKLQGEIERSSGRTAKLKDAVRAREETAKELSQEFAHQQAAAQAAVAKLDEIEQQAADVQEQLDLRIARRAEMEPTIAAAESAIVELETRVNAVEQELCAHEEVIQAHDGELDSITEQQTAAKIELARTEQKLESMTASLEQTSLARAERNAAVAEAESELRRLERRVQEAELQILQLTASLAEDYIRCEKEEAALEVLATQAAELRRARSSASKRLDSVTRAIDKLRQQELTATSELERLEESIATLRKRYTEDYQINFDELSEQELLVDPETKQQLDSEASKLRRDIASVGQINMAALAELDELQERYDYLNNQYEDLRAAKESLSRIVHKINADSRRMFMETLEIIRQNFQKLYRKSFGGGNADIVLEEGSDVLECGIDIIATPPGKTALSNSLLSGGEKALTAVALLLAIFQYRPSPFCVLDEVDAPFDEANIGRFVSVLTEFLDWTKFIIVTHSKKTMTSATTLYGVTMQESGVSKQVAVKFEDVNEKGEILKSDEKSMSQRRAA